MEKNKAMNTKRIGLVIKNEAEAEATAEKLIKTLKDRCVVIDAQKPDNTDIPDDLLCIVILGGDGTFLSVARFIADKDIWS